MNLSQIELLICTCTLGRRRPSRGSLDTRRPQGSRLQPQDSQFSQRWPPQTQNLGWEICKRCEWRRRAPAGFLNFSTGNLTVDPNNVKFWNSKKHLKKANKLIAADTNLSVKEVWGERGHFEESRICHLGFKSFGPTNWTLSTKGFGSQQIERCQQSTKLHCTIVMDSLVSIKILNLNLICLKFSTSLPQERQSTSWWSAARTMKLPVEKIKLLSSAFSSKGCRDPGTPIEAKSTIWQIVQYCSSAVVR